MSLSKIESQRVAKIKHEKSINYGWRKRANHDIVFDERETTHCAVAYNYSNFPYSEDETFIYCHSVLTEIHKVRNQVFDVELNRGFEFVL